jgi:hypothetical protein
LKEKVFNPVCVYGVGKPKCCLFLIKLYCLEGKKQLAGAAVVVVLVPLEIKVRIRKLIDKRFEIETE